MVSVAICTKCKIEKPIDEYYPRNTKAGYRRDCKECTNKVKSRLWKERCSKNKCKRCDNPRLKGSRVCLYHCIKNICVKSDIDFNLIPLLLEKLQNQNYRCYYTDKLLIPGDNLSIDHIIPQSKQGTSDISNLIWVDIAVNRIKSSVSLEEFLKDSSSIIEEIKFLASLENESIKEQKLNYVLNKLN